MPGLKQAGRIANADFRINRAVGGQGVKVVLADIFVGDNVQGNFHVFVPGNWSVIIKVVYVQGQEPGIGGGNNDIQQTFGCREASAVCGGNSWKIQFVTSHCDADSVGFRLLWTNAGD